MIKYNYYKLSKSKKIRYLKNNQKGEPYNVFLHGFKSDLDGKKPKTLMPCAVWTLDDITRIFRTAKKSPNSYLKKG